MDSIRKVVREQLESFCWTDIPAENDEIMNGVNSIHSDDELRFQKLEECIYLLKLALQGAEDDDFKLSKIHTILFSFDKYGKN